MTSEGLITALEGTTLEEAKKILAKARKEKLPIVDKDFNLKGLITIKDIEKQIKYPLSAKDSQGRLLCGAAIGITAVSYTHLDVYKRQVLRKTKKGRKYYGCEDNPECEFMSWQKPSDQKCPRCGSYMVEKGNKLCCSNEQCGFVENQKKDKNK